MHVQLDMRLALFESSGRRPWHETVAGRIERPRLLLREHELGRRRVEGRIKSRWEGIVIIGGAREADVVGHTVVVHPVEQILVML